MENLFTITCEDKDCNYEFITNSTEITTCPNCGTENIDYTPYKVEIPKLELYTLAIKEECIDILENNLDDELEEYTKANLDSKCYELAENFISNEFFSEIQDTIREKLSNYVMNNISK